MAFPFEALELFTYQLKKVAASRYVGMNAPPGLLATLNGLAGGMHYGFGKGTGGLIGGAIVAYTRSIGKAFRYFGIAAAVTGLIYFIYEYFYANGFARYYRKSLQNKPNNDNGNEENPETMQPFLDMKDMRRNSVNTAQQSPSAPGVEEIEKASEPPRYEDLSINRNEKT